MGATLVDPSILMITVDFVVNLTNVRPVSERCVRNEAGDAFVHGIPHRAVSAEVDIEGLFAFRANEYAVGAVHTYPELSRNGRSGE